MASDEVEQSGNRTGRVQSVDRAIALLKAVGAAPEPGSTVAEIATVCGLNRATAWRILTTLEAGNFVACNRTTGHWRLGIGLVELAGASGVDTLIRSAHDTLGVLAKQTGETASLAIFRSGKLTYVDEVVPTSVVAATWRGREVALHATSTGKALLAHLHPDSVETLLAPGLPRYTATTITDRDDLDRELAATRERGYGTCRGEFESSAYGVSAPVLDSVGYPLALLSIWGPDTRLTADRFHALGEIAKQAAESIARP